jgi:glycosyltransferase involved in cell wall biosynthesis
MYYLLKYRKKEDIIITVSNPFSSHLIGLILKKFGKHPWKMDIGDIYYGNQHHSWLSKWFERIILNSADHIVVNAESLRNHFLTLYRLLQEKITVIPNGVHIDLSKINKTKSDTIRLSYIGNTYQDIREGIPELELLRKMVTLDNSNKYQIQLYGTQYFKVSEWSERHPGFISISHCKNEEELIQAYSNTDILVNFAHRNNPGLPSKLEEYVASGLPIINFYYTEQDPSYVFLNTNTSIAYHCNLNAPNIQALQTFIELTRDSDLINK